VYRPGGPVPLNVFPCRREYLDPPAGRLTPQHARIYLLTLPPSMAKQVCGAAGGAGGGSRCPRGPARGATRCQLHWLMATCACLTEGRML
jgi:hypothetical protein